MLPLFLIPFSISLIKALPTTIPSAYLAILLALSQEFIPNPTTKGILIYLFKDK